MEEAKQNNLINIGGRNYSLKKELKNGIKLLRKYEEVTGRNGLLIKDNLSDTIDILYCMLLLSNPDFGMTLEEFIEHIDQNPAVLNEAAMLTSDTTPGKKKRAG